MCISSVCVRVSVCDRCSGQCAKEAAKTRISAKEPQEAKSSTNPTTIGLLPSPLLDVPLRVPSSLTYGQVSRVCELRVARVTIMSTALN